MKFAQMGGTQTCGCGHSAIEDPHRKRTAFLQNQIRPDAPVLTVLAITDRQTLRQLAYGTFVLFLPVAVRGIGTAHFGFEGRNKEHKDPRLSISTPTGPWVK